jgi:multiple sugar transport system permease protein
MSRVASRTVEGRRTRIVAVTARYALLVVIAAVFIFPIVFMIVSSLKPDLQLLRDTSSFRAFLPVGDISLNNYGDAFERVPILRFLFNSMFVTLTTLVFGLFFCSLAGFAFAVPRWPGRGVILSIIIATFIIPFETIAIPLLLIVNNLPWIGAEGFTTGWLNSYHVQIIPFIADALSIYLFATYFRDLPRELVEAARIDGAGWWQIYLRVFVPIAGPVFATAAILKFLAMYNQYLWPLMVAQGEQYRPVMVGLQYFFQLNIAWGEIMAYLTIITLPVLAFYLSLQRAFIESIAASGVKG